MPGGRPPKPTKLKLIQGNPGRRPLPREPTPPSGETRAPVWLKGRGRRAWGWMADVLGPMGLLTTADPHALALLCDAYAEYIEARQIVRKEGMTYECTTKAGDVMIRPRPEVNIAADAWRRVSGMLQQFGMTPASRAKVHAGPAEEQDPLGAFLANGSS